MIHIILVEDKGQRISPKDEPCNLPGVPPIGGAVFDHKNREWTVVNVSMSMRSPFVTIIVKDAT